MKKLIPCIDRHSEHRINSYKETLQDAMNALTNGVTVPEETKDFIVFRRGRMRIELPVKVFRNVP